MSTSQSMTLVTALSRPHMEGHVVRALHEPADCPGFTLTQARGQGRGRGAGGTYKAGDYGPLDQRHLCLRIVCSSPRADGLCRTVEARDGELGEPDPEHVEIAFGLVKGEALRRQDSFVIKAEMAEGSASDEH